MRLDPKLTPEQTRQAFEDALHQLSLKGVLLPSEGPFGDGVRAALDAVAAAYPAMSAGQIAEARVALERQLDGTTARAQAEELERLVRE